MKGKTKCFAVCALACALTAAAGTAMLPADAQRVSAAQTEAAEAQADPRALFAFVSLRMEGSDGEVRAIAKNQFTFLPGIVEVQIELYSSAEYRESYKGMTLERRIYISDLNQGQELVARASTNGEESYWIARMTSEVDGSGKEEKVMGPKLFSGNGDLIASWGD